MSSRAPFIALEGPEGAGKTVQSRHLADWLQQQGWRVRVTREPGGTSAGDAIRAILLQSDDLHLLPETEALLMAASRAQHVRELILPAIKSGEIVITDRYVDSSYAYQGGGRELGQKPLQPIQDFATGGLQPDIRLLLDLSVEVGLARRHGETDQVNRIDRAPLEFHQRVRSTYRALAEADPGRWDIIDASQERERVAEEIILAVSRRLEQWSASTNA